VGPVAERTAAAVAHTAAAAVEMEGPAAAARPERAVGPRSLRRIPAEAVATEPLVVQEALPLRKPPPPSLVRRKKGSLSSREEHRVRIADISS